MITALLKEYSNAIRLINATKSKSKKLFTIIDFFKNCKTLGHYPPNKSFLEEFIPLLLNIFKTSPPHFFDPQYLLELKSIFRVGAERLPDQFLQSELKAVSGLIRLLLIRTYFYLGEEEKGKQLINDFSSSMKTQYNSGEQERKTVVTNDNRSLPVISEEEPAILKIIEEIKKEINQLDYYSDFESNILLVEDDDESRPIGLIKTIECRINEKKKIEDGIIFENFYDEDREQLQQFGNNIIEGFHRILISAGRKSEKTTHRITLRFTGVQHLFRGDSFGIGAVTALFCRSFNGIQNRKKYYIKNTVSFSGSIKNGKVVRLPPESLAAKINAAFFSWIKIVVLPQENLEESVALVKALNKRFPQKELSLIGIDSVEEILNHKEIFIVENQPVKKIVSEHWKRNLQLYLPLLFVILFYPLLTLYKLAFPTPLKPLPQTTYAMSIIYAPDRKPQWLFTNNNQFGGDTVDFHEVAIGDYWAPKFELWNNSAKPEQFGFEITGKDKNEFQVMWRYEAKQPSAPNEIEPDILQRFYIKFFPQSVGVKSAVLQIFSHENPEHQKKIFLKGDGKYYERGYSLMLTDADDDAFIEPKSMLLSDEYTLEFWLKPFSNINVNVEHFGLLKNQNDENEKFGFSINSDSLLVLGMSPRKAKSGGLKLKQKIRFDEWNFIALSFSKKQIDFLVNDNTISVTKNLPKQKLISDLFSFQRVYNPKKSKSMRLPSVIGTVLIDEFRVWKKKKSITEIRKNQFISLSGNEKDLLFYHNYDETNPEAVFDLSPNDIWGTCAGGIGRSLDSPPINKTIKLSKSVLIKDSVLSLSSKGMLRIAKPVFKKPSSLTLSLDFMIPTRNDMPFEIFSFSTPEVSFVVVFQKDLITGAFDDKITNGQQEKSANAKLKNGFNQFAFVYSYEGDSASIFLNGKHILSLNKISNKFDITRWCYSISIGNNSFFYSPHTETVPKLIDNVKFFNRVLTQNELTTATENGLILNYTFSKSKNNIVFDEINNAPALIFDGEIVIGNIRNLGI